MFIPIEKDEAPPYVKPPPPKIKIKTPEKIKEKAPVKIVPIKIRPKTPEKIIDYWPYSYKYKPGVCLHCKE